MIHLKVLVVNPGLAERLRKHLPPDIELLTPETGADPELIQLAADVEVIVATMLNPAVAEAAPNLKLLQKTGAGVDALPFDSLGDDVWVANTSGTNPYPLAEGAVAMVFALAKRLIPRNTAFPSGRDTVRGVELRGKNVAVVGYGNIGREIGNILRGAGMHVMAIKRTTDPEVAKTVSFLGTREDLPHVLAEADFTVLTVPLTPATRGMIGEKELRLMKSTSYLVNVARAGIIQEEPLYRALKEGWIAGAGLDVWWTPHWWDPIWNPEMKGPSDYPVWELPNVICTPHNVGSTDTKSDAGVRLMAENIVRVRDGKPPLNQVDKKHRY